ncbi:MAG: diaminopimelate decarboxylase, partial [Sporichthyaceae bacterium]
MNLTRNAAGVAEFAGVDVRDLAAQFGTPAFLLDEADFRARARGFVDAFTSAHDLVFGGSFGGGAPQHRLVVPGKAILGGAVAKWFAEEGLRHDGCRRG